MRDALPAHAHGKKLEVWWQDEMRVGQHGQLTRIWGLKGSRPYAPKDMRFKSAYVFGAVCPAHDKGAALIEPFANTVAMERHLKEISLHVAPDAHAVILMDQAGWHTTDKLNIPDNITLLELPAASPELNPQENIWQYLRSNYLCNRVFDTYEDILDACEHAWNQLIKSPGQIKSIATRQWAKIDQVNL